MRTFGRRGVEGAGPEDGAGLPAPSPDEIAPARQRPDMEESTLRQRVLKQVDPNVAAELSAPALHRQIEQLINDIANEDRLELSGVEQGRLAEALVFDMVGFGPIEPLLRDSSVSDIMINGPDQVYVERFGKLERAAVRFRDNEHIAAIGYKMAARVGRRIDESSPMVDARLPDGSRVNAIFPPLAVDSPSISIRKFGGGKYDLKSMAASGSMTAPVAALLAIAGKCRLNMLISGGTGSGKTTLLNAISRTIDPGERIITIEDACELKLQQPHVVRLETRPPNLEGRGEITQRDLMRNALRMRPDRIIIGEVRGAEAFDMLQAMNTGHDGSISTIHANTARDAITRVENMVQMGYASLPVSAIRAQIIGAVDLIVQVERMRDGVRRVVQITEICGQEGDTVTTNDVARLQFDPAGRPRYTTIGAKPTFLGRLEYFNQDGAWMDALKEI